MFSGIIETLGYILSLKRLNGCMHLIIEPHLHFDDMKVGDSLSVNGVCLTITKCDGRLLHVTLVPETLNVTTLQYLSCGDVVNLERSLQVGARIGGHFVQGHIDTLAEITTIQPDGDAILVVMTLAEKWLKYIVKKGFITIDGMSITVIDVMQSSFSVTFIPHTMDVTKTHTYQLGSLVNIEVDILGKYIEKFSGAYTHDNSN